MTVSTSASRVVYIGNGSTTVFPFAFKVAQASELVVVYTDADGADHALSSGVYNASGFNQDAGGTVTYPLSGSPIASGTRLTIYRDVPLTQPTAISNQGAMWPQAIEGGLDRLTWQAQKLQEQVSRSVRVSPNEPSALAPVPERATRANKLMGFDGDGQPTVIGFGDLSSLTDALAIDYTPGWAGAITRSVRERLQDRFDIRDFGGVGDGVTDNTAAFQAAADIAANLNQGQDDAFLDLALNVPAGVFRAGQILIPDNFSVRGVSAQSSRIVGLEAQQDYLFRATKAGAEIDFRQLELMGWDGASAGLADNVIVLDDGTLTIERCRVNRANGLVWAKKGNDTALSMLKMGFFRDYACRFGGVDNGTSTTRNVSSASFANGARTIVIDGSTPDLQAFDRVTVAGMGTAAWNGTFTLAKGTGVATANTLKIVLPADAPGAPGTLGTVTYSKSNGAAISEIRLDQLKMYSGAKSLFGPDAETPDPTRAVYTGRQIILDTDCGATVITNCDGGSTEIGIEVIDSLALGNRRSAGFVHAELYTSGNCNTAGVWIKANGGTTEWIGCKFSAPGDDAGNGMIVDSPNASVALSGCTFQNCKNDGVRILRAFSLTENGTKYRDIGRSGQGGIALHCVEGLAKITGSGMVYDQNLQAVQGTVMDYAVRCQADFRGDVHIAACHYKDLAVTAFSSAIAIDTWLTSTVYQIDDVVTRDDLKYICLEEHTSGLFPAWVTATAYEIDDVVTQGGVDYICLVAHTSGVFATDLAVGKWKTVETFAGDLAVGRWELRRVGLNAYDNDDIAVVPPRSTPEQVREYKARHATIWITQPFETVWTDTCDLTGLTGSIISTHGTSPVIRSDATTILKIGGHGGGSGNGWRDQVCDISIMGEFFITRDAAKTTGVVGIEIVADTYDVDLDYIRVDKVGTAIRAPLGPIHGIHVGKLYHYDCVDGGIDFFSSAPNDEIGHVTIDWIDSNTSEAQGWAVGISIGPNVGSGGKTSLIVNGGIIYRHRHALHFWGVQNVLSATYAAGICTVTMTKAHYKAPGDVAVFAGFDQAQANGSFTLLGGSAGRVFKFAIADPGVATLTGKAYYTVNAAIQQTAGINFDGPRKARINNLTIRGPVSHGIYVEGGADINLLGVTIDDPGIFSVYGARITALSWSGGQIIVTLDPAGPGHDCLVNEYFNIKRSNSAGTGSYNGTFQCTVVDNDHTLRAAMANDPGTATELGLYYHPEDNEAAGLYVDLFFHGKLTMHAGQIHEANGPGVSWNALYALGLHMSSVVQWNGSWAAPGVKSNFYCVPGASNVFLEDCSFGIADHWRHANRTPTFSGLPAAADTLTLGGTVITFVNGAPATAFQVQRDGGVTLANFIVALATLINGSLDANLQKIVAEPGATSIKLTAVQPGASGNTFTLAKSSAAITLGAATLGGGTGQQTGKWGLEGFVANIRGNRAVNVRGEGSSGLYSMAQPALPLGTPQSGDLSNCINLPILTGVSGLAANVAAFLANPTSANLRAVLTDEVGTGVALFAQEGTFTPGVSFSIPGDLSVVYTTQTGSYARLGNFVVFVVNLIFTPTFTTASSSFTITGYPFTSAEPGEGSINTNGVTFPAGVVDIVASWSATSSISIRGNKSAAASVVLAATEFTSGASHTIRVTGTMKVV